MPRLQGTSVNICKNLILPESTVTALHLCCWQYGSILIEIFVVGSENVMCFETECEMAVQGHPRSLILVTIDSVYATSY